jgi:hypothetical protein
MARRACGVDLVKIVRLRSGPAMMYWSTVGLVQVADMKLMYVEKVRNISNETMYRKMIKCLVTVAYSC